jgi:hypothetical protein
MDTLSPAASGERIVDTMIELARCSKLHRIIVAGSRGPHQMFELHRRGYNRVATTAACGLPRGQYDVAFIEWQLHSVKALATTLDWLVHFLTPAGILVIWVDPNEHPDHRKLQSILDRLGFRIEAGTRSEHGLAISARRLDANEQVIAA